MLNTIFNTLYAHLHSIVAPPFCQGCSQFLEQETIFCDNCWSHVYPVAPTILAVTEQKSVTVHALGAYAFPLKKLILAKNHQSIAASANLGHALWQKTDIRALPFDYIIPIPLHWTRRRWRGFNQAEEMSVVLSGYSQKKVINALSRNRKTVFQAECNKQEREKNLHGAFTLVVDMHILKGKTVLLVDDLLTTGSTLTQAARVLYQSGVKIVIAAVGCRTL